MAAELLAYRDTAPLHRSLAQWWFIEPKYETDDTVLTLMTMCCMLMTTSCFVVLLNSKTSRPLYDADAIVSIDKRNCLLSKPFVIAIADSIISQTARKTVLQS